MLWNTPGKDRLSKPSSGRTPWSGHIWRSGPGNVWRSHLKAAVILLAAVIILSILVTSALRAYAHAHYDYLTHDSMLKPHAGLVAVHAVLTADELFAESDA